MVIDGNRSILIIGKKVLFKKNFKSELSPKRRPDRPDHRLWLCFLVLVASTIVSRQIGQVHLPLLIFSGFSALFVCLLRLPPE